MTVAAGIDIVSVARIDALIRRSGDGFTQRWFTPAEIAYCTGKAVPSRHFAARMAAKEAVAKILPSGWDGPLAWKAIEILGSSDAAPSVRLAGRPLALAQQAGLGGIGVSMSHCDDYATAIAFARDEAAGT
ncbi:holo-ACP synthase [Gordonia phosphorivorans]|uniref:Holo-[acyl-carrier-protein] synthase n=1 Tax=Gordonia phosphorivorans TaxID=1056982 RepID=A0ABV6H4Z4_9ACTN